MFAHFSAISAGADSCLHFLLHSTSLYLLYLSPQNTNSSFLNSSPLLLFSLLHLFFPSVKRSPQVCVISIKKEERLPVPSAPDCESLQPASYSATLTVTSQQMWNYKGWGDGKVSYLRELQFKKKKKCLCWRKSGSWLYCPWSQNGHIESGIVSQAQERSCFC